MSFTTCYQRVNSDVVKATLTKNIDDETSGASKISPIVVLDVSGSMAGTRLDKCVQCINNILQQVGSAHLITYSSNATNFGVVTSVPHNVYASGMTNFDSAYKEIINTVKKLGGSNQILFFTDGEETSNPNGLYANTKNFETDLKTRESVVHTIGIDNSSHTELMLRLSRCGSADGTYGYLSDKESYLLETERLVGTMGKCTKVEFNNKSYFLGTRPVDVYINDKTMTCESTGLLGEIDYLSHKLKLLTEEIKTTELADVEKLVNDSARIFKEAGKLSRVSRKIVRSSLESVHAVVNELYNLLNSNQRITHEKLAQLNVAARDARSNRFVKQSVKRAEQNVEIIAKEDEQLIKASEHITTTYPDDIPDQPDYSCMLSCYNVSELLKDGDCLGVGVMADVKEACLVDPTLLKVTDISTSQFGCGSFLEAAEYALKVNPIAFGEQTNVVLDSSRQSVSGVLPLYLNDVHWSIAKLYARRMAAHLCCKDPFSGSNKITFYTYLKAYNYCRSQEGEFYEKISTLLIQTLKKLFEVMPGVIVSPSQFCDDVSKRMPDFVPSLTLLRSAYTALGLECDNPNFENYVEEEKIRRRKNKLNIGDLLTVDHDTWVKPYVSSKLPMNNGSNYLGSLRTHIKSRHPDALPYFDKTISAESSNCEVVEVVVPDSSTYEPVVNQEMIKNKFEKFSESKRCLLLLQTNSGLSATEYVQKYKDYFVIDDCSDEFKTICTGHIDLLRQSALTTATTEIGDLTTRNNIAALLGGVSLLERVAILYSDCYVGRNILYYYKTCNSLEDLAMLIRGYYDISKLIGYHEELMIRTVIDIDVYECITRKDTSQQTLKGRWYPSHRDLRKLCRVYNIDSLKQITSLDNEIDNIVRNFDNGRN